MDSASLIDLFDRYRATDDLESVALTRLRHAARTLELWSRSAPLHVTGSAIVFDQHEHKILLRWHDGLEGWLQVGGHVDSSDADLYTTALREAEEETGLTDLIPWPPALLPTPIHIVVVDVPERGLEAAHEHADVRYVFATKTGWQARPETASTPLRWLSIAEALELVEEENLTNSLLRVKALVGPA